MSSSKFVSIIIPIYNKGIYLEECLQSIDNQIYRNFEVLLIDDGSTDIASGICDNYVNTHSNAKVFHTSNNGVSIARNIGLENAKGDYIVFVDADDILEKHYLEVQVALMQKSNNTMAIIGHERKSVNNLCSSSSIDDAILLQVDDIYNNIIRNEQIRGYVWNKIFSRSIIEQNHIRFLPNVITWEDLYFVLQYMEFIPSAYICYKKHYYYRIIPNSNISSEIRLKRIDIAKKISEFKREGCTQFHEDAEGFYLNAIVSFCWSAYREHTLTKDQKKYFFNKIRQLHGIKYLDIVSILKLVIIQII